MSSTTWLLLVYIAAAISEVYGLYATVTTYVREDPNHTGLYDIVQAETRAEQIRGPFFIVLGVLIGLGGNIASLYVN